MTPSSHAVDWRLESDTPLGTRITASRRFGETPKSPQRVPKAANDSQPQRIQRPATGPLVLVVDDDPEHCAYMAEVLARRGCRVGMALNGRDAISRLEQEAFETVVTDVYMPDLDGIELVRALRERWPALKVVAVTGGGIGHPTGVRNFLKYLGVLAVLNKPFEPRELVQAVENPASDNAD